jgi:FkbM family methyltransferase
MMTCHEWEPQLLGAANRFDLRAATKNAQDGCWIYGAGGFGRLMATALAHGGYPILGFIDRSARTASKVGQYPCIHPNEFDPADAKGKAYVHGLMNHTFPSGDVARWASGLPFARLLFPAEVCQLPNIELDNYWLAKPSTLLANAKEIGLVHDALADAASAEAYRGVLSYRISSDPRIHPPVSVKDQYAADFLPIFGKPMTVIDAGAYTGDTLETLIAHGVDVRDWIAFEPDQQNFEKLTATAKTFRNTLQRYTIFPCGLAETSGKIVFTQGEGPSSRVLHTEAAPATTESLTSIQALRLADVVWRPLDNLYIKLDIEGAEQSALNGMMELLADRRPTVAVSIYHKPADLWEIPRFFMRNFDRPKLYVRQHGHHGFDTVLYVVL